MNDHIKQSKSKGEYVAKGSNENAVVVARFHSHNFQNDKTQPIRYSLLLSHLAFGGWRPIGSTVRIGIAIILLKVMIGDSLDRYYFVSSDNSSHYTCRLCTYIGGDRECEVISAGSESRSERTKTALVDWYGQMAS